MQSYNNYSFVMMTFIQNNNFVICSFWAKELAVIHYFSLLSGLAFILNEDFNFTSV